MSRRLDPRYYQIGALGTLLTYGIFHLRFDMTLPRALLIVGLVLATQYACTLAWRLPAFDFRSALISGFSLSLFLRTNDWRIAAFGAVITILSKFVFRWKGKHLFNPTNFSVVALLLLFPNDVWVSAGQWGNGMITAFFMLGMGSLVVYKSRRNDITLSFLAFWAIVLFGRSLYLGEPMTIPWHRMQSGLIILFAYHMISDPKSTPDSRAGRILFSSLVAAGAGLVQFGLFRTNGLLWSLAACHLLVPLIDKILPGDRFDWGGPGRGVRPHAPTKVSSIEKLEGPYAPIPA